MAYRQVIVDVHGAVATVRMNNPDRLNALSGVMTGELIRALQGLSGDPAIRAVILTGEGRGFCVGADLSELKEPYLQGERFRPSTLLVDGYNRLVPLLVDMPKPVVAAVNGAVAGAGMSLALGCDLRIAGEGATFSMAFVKIGLIPDAGSSYLLPRAVGMARALELALLSDRLDAGPALDAGLVHRVVPQGELMEEARVLAERLAALPTTAIGLTKMMFEDSSRLSLAEAMQREAEVQDRAAQSADHVEGVLAFLEKRPPTFTGR